MELLRHEAELSPILPIDGEQATRDWAVAFNEIRRLAIHDDPTRFLRWMPIQQMMYPGGRAPHVPSKLEYLRSLPDYEKRWRTAIQEDQVGHPVVLPEWDHSSSMLITHAYHLAQLRQEKGVNLWEADVIMEYGGGYGSMFRLLRKLGFVGQYIIFDMPIMNALQRYYFRELGVTTNFPICVSSPEAIADTLGNLNSGKWAFLATMSFTETPISQRDWAWEMLKDYPFDLCFFGYDAQYYGIDNQQWFNDNLHPGYFWYRWQADIRPNKYYMVATTTSEWGMGHYGYDK